MAPVCLLVVLATLASCALDRPSAPRVVVEVDPATNAEDRDSIDAGANAWILDGFIASVVLGQRTDAAAECPQRWYLDGTTDCTLTVQLYRVPNLIAQTGASGLSDVAMRTTQLDASLTGALLWAVTAHELGHQLAHTSAHLGSGVPGVMASSSTTSDPTAADYGLVCAQLGADWCGVAP